MRKSRFTEAQIIGVLQEAASGAAVKEVVRRHGIASPTHAGTSIVGRASYNAARQHAGAPEVTSTPTRLTA